MEMKKTVAILALLTLCLATAPLSTSGQNNKSLSDQNIGVRAEVSQPDHFDRSRALREMFDRGDRPEKARGGRDFEPGRPEAVGNTNPSGIDPLVDRSI